jgi:hypothetical protein
MFKGVQFPGINEDGEAEYVTPTDSLPEPEPEPESKPEPIKEDVNELQQLAQLMAASQQRQEQLLEALSKKPPEAEFDPEKFWSVDPEDPHKGKTLHSKLEEFWSMKNANQQKDIRDLQAALHVMMARSTDPSFASVEKEAFELVRDGKVNDLSTAAELIRLRKGTSAPNVPRGRAPSKAKAHPIPPATASTPTAKQGKSKSEVFRNFKELKQDPEIQQAMAALRAESSGGFD